MDGDGRQGVQSLEKGMSVLKALAAAGEPLRLGQVAELVGMTPSKAHAYLTSLVRTGMAYQDHETSRYGLGEETLLLGLSALRKLDAVILGRSALAELKKSTAETSFIATWSSRGPLIVAKMEDPIDSVFALQVGAAISFFPSASGRVFMTYLPRERWEHLLPKDIGAGRLEREIKSITTAIRKDGMASVDPTTLPSHSVLAAPVFDHEGTTKAVLSLVGSRQSFDSDLKGKPAKLLLAAALSLSKKLGWEGKLL